MFSTLGWLDNVIGGWQVSSVIRYRTGLPTTVGGNLAYNANYWLSSLAILTQPVTHRRRHRPERQSQHLRQHQRRQLVLRTSCPATPARGRRYAWRPFFNTDLTLPKTFRLPKEGQSILFRAEAFNVFNNVNFTNPSLSLTAPLTFGEFQQTTPPREMQFALRYEF